MGTSWSNGPCLFCGEETPSASSEVDYTIRVVSSKRLPNTPSPKNVEGMTTASMTGDSFPSEPPPVGGDKETAIAAEVEQDAGTSTLPVKSASPPRGIALRSATQGRRHSEYSAVNHLNHLPIRMRRASESWAFGADQESKSPPRRGLVSYTSEGGTSISSVEDCADSQSERLENEFGQALGMMKRVVSLRTHLHESLQAQGAPSSAFSGGSLSSVSSAGSDSVCQMSPFAEAKECCVPSEEFEASHVNDTNSRGSTLHDALRLGTVRSAAPPLAPPASKMYRPKSSSFTLSQLDSLAYSSSRSNTRRRRRSSASANISSSPVISSSPLCDLSREHGNAVAKSRLADIQNKFGTYSLVLS